MELCLLVVYTRRINFRLQNKAEKIIVIFKLGVEYSHFLIFQLEIVARNVFFEKNILYSILETYSGIVCKFSIFVKF